MKPISSHRATPKARSSASFQAHIADELRRYDEHLRDVRGLAASTRKDRLYVAGMLLRQKFKDRAINISRLRPDDVRQFLANQQETHRTASNASRLAAALRSYLRYRATCGDPVGKLTAVILNPVHWKLASLPRALKPDEIERLLSSFTDDLRWPKRGYAIIRCALDMGLKAVRAWVRFNRQFTAESPLLPSRDGSAMTRSNVTKRLLLAVRTASEHHPRLTQQRVSPHTIRHTTAMHLLQAGVDISVIALWLGYESPVTTHHYVEADLTMKERALARLHEPDVKIQRYRAPDSLIDFLKTL